MEKRAAIYCRLSREDDNLACDEVSESIQNQQKLLCEYAFGFLSLKQLYAHVAVDNEVCLKLFASCGFTQCGLLKNWLQVEGCYKDAVLLQCLNPRK